MGVIATSCSCSKNDYFDFSNAGPCDQEHIYLVKSHARGGVEHWLDSIETILSVGDSVKKIMIGHQEIGSGFIFDVSIQEKDCYLSKSEEGKEAKVQVPVTVKLYKGLYSEKYYQTHGYVTLRDTTKNKNDKREGPTTFIQTSSLIEVMVKKGSSTEAKPAIKAAVKKSKMDAAAPPNKAPTSQ